MPPDQLTPTELAVAEIIHEMDCGCGSVKTWDVKVARQILAAVTPIIRAEAIREVLSDLRDARAELAHKELINTGHGRDGHLDINDLAVLAEIARRHATEGG